MRHKQFVLLIRSRKSKTQDIVVLPRLLSLDPSFPIRNILSCPPPAILHILHSPILAQRVDSWRHAIVEQRVRLGKVDDGEGIRLVGQHVSDRKVEPLVATAQ